MDSMGFKCISDNTLSHRHRGRKTHTSYITWLTEIDLENMLNGQTNGCTRKECSKCDAEVPGTQEIKNKTKKRLTIKFTASKCDRKL